jgi:hypothetical protein
VQPQRHFAGRYSCDVPFTAQQVEAVYPA